MSILVSIPTLIEGCACSSCTGVGAPQDITVAAGYVDKILHPPPTRPVLTSDRARALALLAHLFTLEFQLHGPETLTAALYRAAIPANSAAALGYVPSIVLMTAQTIERSGCRDPSKHPPGRSTNPFLDLTDLWRVWDARVVEMMGELDQRDAKVREHPQLYICARKGCGIEAVHKSGLKRCSGKCPSHGKPAYCSKECQKLVCPKYDVGWTQD